MKTKLMALEALKFAYNECDSQWVQDTKIQPAIEALEADIANEKKLEESDKFCTKELKQSRPTQEDILDMARSVELIFNEDAGTPEAVSRHQNRVLAFSELLLYTTPQEPAAAIPEGWKMVPVDPTDEMLVSGQEAWAIIKPMRNAIEDCEESMCVYRAMLAAAPRGAA